MSKDEFFKIDLEKRRDMVISALCNIIIFEDLAPLVCDGLIKKENCEVIKIILGAYKDGILVEREIVVRDWTIEDSECPDFGVSD